jgi:OOP family OmpA-OmpF porin
MRILPLALLGLSSSVQAQDVDGFDFSGSLLDAAGGLQVSSAELGEPGAFYAGLGAVLADRPLVIALPDDTERVLVGRQTSTRLLVGYTTPWNTRIDLQAPYYPHVEVEGQARSGMGDVRASALILTSLTGPVGFAIQPHLVLPTGDASLLVSDGLSGGLAAVISGDADPLLWHAQLGADVGASTCVDNGSGGCLGDVDLGQDLLGGFGLDLPVGDKVTLGGELVSRIGLAGGNPSFNKNPTDVHAHVTFGDGSGLVASLAGGTGIVAGIGAPAWRTTLVLGWRDTGTPPDRDADGIVDEFDECIDEPEDMDGYRDDDGCPEWDNDNDGVLDRRDGCPDKKEDLDGVDDEDGCPEYDNDGDLVLDVSDKCPNEYGPPLSGGCPDRDGDRVPDSVDQCMRTPGPKDNNGCPLGESR